MQIVALLGSTGSGKTDLSIGLAESLNANIFSLDSLSVYKKIDIASAKPSAKLRSLVPHFGIDLINPDEKINVFKIKEELIRAIDLSRNIVIVGGSSFYLRAILDGLSPHPSSVSFDKNIDLIEKVHNLDSKTLHEKYNFLAQIDNEHAIKINPSDRFRIERALEIVRYGISVSEYFKAFPPVPFGVFLESRNIHPIKLFNLVIDANRNRDLISKRTKQMLESGLIDECKSLLDEYGRNILPFKSIGLRECLEYLDSKISLEELENLIAIHTSQLAKRQRTFNRTQFKDIKNVESLKDIFHNLQDK